MSNRKWYTKLQSNETKGGTCTCTCITFLGFDCGVIHILLLTSTCRLSSSSSSRSWAPSCWGNLHSCLPFSVKCTNKVSMNQLHNTGFGIMQTTRTYNWLCSKHNVLASGYHVWWGWYPQYYSIITNNFK